MGHPRKGGGPAMAIGLAGALPEGFPHSLPQAEGELAPGEGAACAAGAEEPDRPAACPLHAGR